MSKESVKDVEMSFIEDDLQKIQIKTNMYLQSYEQGGVFHMIKEAAQNGVDENEDPNSMGHELIITIDKKINKITIEDDGRGIPEDKYPIDIVCTKLQAGSKFFRAQGGKSSGEFGVIKLAPVLSIIGNTGTLLIAGTSC